MREASVVVEILIERRLNLLVKIVCRGGFNYKVCEKI